MMKIFPTNLTIVISLLSILMFSFHVDAATDDTSVNVAAAGFVEEKHGGTKQETPADVNGSAVAASAADANSVTTNPMSSGYLLQLILGLIVVLICIVVLAWVAKRVNRLQSSTNGMLKIVGGLSMGSRERVVLLQVGAKQLLIGVAPGNINMLHVLDGELTDNPSTEDAASGTNFSEKLKGMISDASTNFTQKNK